MLSSVSFYLPPAEGLDKPGVGLVVHVDPDIPGYSSIITVPMIGPPIEPGPVFDMSPLAPTKLLVVTGHRRMFLELLKSRRRTFGPNTRQITRPEHLRAEGDAEIVFLSDAHMLPDLEGILEEAMIAQRLFQNVTITNAPGS